MTPLAQKAAAAGAEAPLMHCLNTEVPTYEIRACIWVAYLGWGVEPPLEVLLTCAPTAVQRTDDDPLPMGPLAQAAYLGLKNLFLLWHKNRRSLTPVPTSLLIGSGRAQGWLVGHEGGQLLPNTDPDRVSPHRFEQILEVTGGCPECLYPSYGHTDHTAQCQATP